jgi:biotin carboxylase
MSERQRVLLFVPASSYRLAAFVAAADALGVELLVGTDLPPALRRYGRETHAVDFFAIETSSRQLAEELAAAPVDGVMAVDEKSAALAAAFARTAACRGRYHRLDGVMATRDKRAMRRALEGAVAMPAWQLLEPDGDEACMDADVFPCVVKAPMLSGSQGVLRANDQRELVRAVARIRSILSKHSSPLRREAGFFELVVERYVPGPEYVVEGLMQRGVLQRLAVFDKPDPLEGPTFEETLYVTPSRAPTERQAALVDATERAAIALGLCDGPIHAELRLPPDGEPTLIEIAARSIGGLCSRALVFALGSLERRLLVAALAGDPESLPVDPPASGVMMIPVPHDGVLAHVAGVDEALAVEGIDSLEISIATGEAIRRLPEGDRYLGFIFAHAERAEQVEAALRRAHAQLRFELKPLLTMA